MFASTLRSAGMVPEHSRRNGLGPGISSSAEPSARWPSHDDLFFSTEVDGFLHSVDAQTGKKYWDHDLQSSARTSPLIADGKVYLAIDDSDVFIFALPREKKLIRQIEMEGQVAASPLFANGVLYLTTDKICSPSRRRNSWGETESWIT
jgi:hypothetical protein